MNTGTPMLKQYMGIKAQYPDAILFYRMGDFYEMFFEDAGVASRILGITLTSRGTHNGEKVPMCGVPHHSSQSYITRLVESGKKVAVCEQIEDPRAAKGIVKREVVRVVTPGSILEDGGAEGRSNLFIGALSGFDGAYGLAHVDLATGEFRVTEIEEWEEVLAELGRIDPAEVLVEEGGGIAKKRGISHLRLEPLAADAFDKARAEALLKEQLNVRSLAGFGCEGMESGISAAGAIVHYLMETQKGKPDHIREIVSYCLGDFISLDESTVHNLELYRTMRRQSAKGSLFSILDKTVTPMGSRLLKRWMGYPLLDLHEIRRRLGAVANLKEDRMLREEIGEQLEGVYDLERLNGRIALGRTNARDLVALKTSIERVPRIKERLKDSTSELLSDIAAGLDTLQDVGELIESAIRDDPPVSLKEGGLIKEGYHEELDRLISISRDGKNWIAELGASEQKRTGIPNLKIGYNRVFGYYIELSKANLHLAPADYVRKQTLVNGERFITESLKQYEEMVLGAEERRVALEYEVFEEIRKRVALENSRIKETGRRIGVIDVLAGMAKSAELYGYVRPEVNEGGAIEILEGRHPVIEQTVKDEVFVPNDVYVDDEGQQLLIITGPNMAGKSTVLRQVALTVLMAQMGSFVPASRAVIGLVDRIFTRIGASDDLAKGESTFMVEMNETANILRHATPKSLVILDEIGRGTSTYDGLSIAWAVAEALHDRDNLGVRTLFATHYHELTELVTTKERARNFNIAVKEWGGRIVFLRKLIPGATSRSYGVQVAQIAGIPEKVIQRAREILSNLEREDPDEAGRPRLARSTRRRGKGDGVQLDLFGSRDRGLRERIMKLEISKMTPLEALNELSRLKDELEEREPSQHG